MPIDEDKIFYSNPQDITVHEDLPRYRKDSVKVKELLESILEKKQLHPIIVTENMELVAGGRRLAACLLGSIDVRCMYKGNLTPIQMREIELEENLQREDLSPADEADAVADLHILKQELYGQSSSGRAGGWRLTDTADSIGKTKGKVIDSIQISEALKSFPELRSLKTRKAIKKAVKGCELVAERAAAITQWESVITKESKVDLLHKDAIKDMMEQEDDSIDILLTDPPYGIEIDKIATSVGGSTGGFSTSGYKFDDSTEKALALYELLAGESYRFTTPDAHAYIFVAPEFFSFIRELMVEAGWNVHIKPIIWIKRETGQCNMPERWPSSCYEMLLYIRKDDSRLIQEGKPDWEECPPVSESERLHPWQKPVSLLENLLKRVSLPGQTLYDPFMGSGSSIEAAINLHLFAIGCDNAEECYAYALQRLSKLGEQNG